MVPGKTTARLEGRRQLDTFPAALENPKVPNALPNSRVGEGVRGRWGQRQVRPERAHVGWGGASRWAGSPWRATPAAGKEQRSLLRPS